MHIDHQGCRGIKKKYFYDNMEPISFVADHTRTNTETYIQRLTSLEKTKAATPRGKKQHIAVNREKPM